jgi:hypothetical protein
MVVTRETEVAGLKAMHIDQSQPAKRFLRSAEKHVDGQGGLHASDHAWHSTQHAHFAASLDGARRWRFGVKVPVAWSSGRVKERHSPFETME